MKTILRIVALFFAAGVCYGQQPLTGVPAFGSFQSFGFGDVNIQNLNFNFTIPFVGGPGRGMNFAFGPSYNSSMWVSGGTLWIPAVDPGGAPTWGWNLTNPIGTIPYLYTTSTCPYIVGHTPESGPVTSYGSYEYVEPNGTRHSFSVYYLNVYVRCPDGGVSGVSTGYATDGSGFYIDISISGPGCVQSEWREDNEVFVYRLERQQHQRHRSQFVRNCLV